MPSTRTTIATSAAALALGTYLLFGGPSSDPTVTQDQRAAFAATFNADPQAEITSDGEVSAGGDTDTGVTLPPGTQPTGVIALTGSAAGSFDVQPPVLLQTVAGPYFEVKAHNRSATSMRFTAVVSYAPVPDAGVPVDAPPDAAP